MKAIEEMSREELRELNRKICDRLDFMFRQDALNKMTEFRLGDLVSFDDKDGSELIGRIHRFNLKSVSIVDQYNRKWTVWPNHLRRVEETSSLPVMFN